VSTVSLGAWLRSGAQPLLTAVGRYRRLPGDDDAECGVLVGDALRSQGIGAMLLRRLVAAARAQGIRNLVGYVDPYNLRLLRMIARAGFSCRQHLEEHLLRVSVPVPEEADSPAESVK
jgi:RimJ/RimL family protein N-acetyltransferase